VRACSRSKPLGGRPGVDFIIAETFLDAEEALIALDVIKERAAAVVTWRLHREP